MKFVFSLLATVALMLGVGASAGAAEPKTRAADAPTTGTSVSAEGTAVAFPKAGEMPVMATLDELRHVLKNHGSEILVVNLWATWCGPCVEELPDFVAASKKYPVEKVRFVGLSRDFEEEREATVIPFLKEKGIPYANWLLTSPAEDSVNFFNPAWQGDLPATFFYDKQGRKIAEFMQPVNEELLTAKIEELLRK